MTIQNYYASKVITTNSEICVSHNCCWGNIFNGDGCGLLFLPDIQSFDRRVTILDGLRQGLEVSELRGKKIDSNYQSQSPLVERIRPLP